MNERQNDVAVIGLGVMGANLARNFASHGLKVSGFDLKAEEGQRLAKAYPEADIAVAASVPELVRYLEPPRRIVLLVNAGGAVDELVKTLDPLLQLDDIIVDAGNSLYRDTNRRLELASGRPWRFVGMGVSGGAEGALRGPAIMPGGDQEAWNRLRPVLELAAAKSHLGPCVTYCGRGSAGHFVKMVHNGIEYADMQLIAETAALLRRGLDCSCDEVADIFARWNLAELASFLIEITSDIFRVADPRDARVRLVDVILDEAEQKGTGRWTVIAALELGIPVPTIAAAVDARSMSSFKELREIAEATYGEPGGPVDLKVDELKDALYVSKLISYSQGFQMLAAASTAYDYGTDLGEVARIWTAGCIVRARFLDQISGVLGAAAPPELLVLATGFVEDLVRRKGNLAKVVSVATAAGFPVPGLAASLGWFDTLTTGRGNAYLIQAQRDYFGRHGYRRLDARDTQVSTTWPRSIRR